MCRREFLIDITRDLFEARGLQVPTDAHWTHCEIEDAITFCLDYDDERKEVRVEREVGEDGDAFLRRCLREVVKLGRPVP